MTPLVSIIMGSTSDMKVMEQAAEFLNQMQIPFEINALSAHRVPDLVADFAKKQKKSITDELTKRLPKYFCATSAEHAEDMRYLRPVVEKLLEIVQRYSELLWEEKQKTNSVDF